MTKNRFKRLLNQNSGGVWSTTLTVLLTAAIVIFFPNVASAGAIGEFLGFFTGSSFYCSDDLGAWSALPSVPVGTLYDNGIASCETLGVEHLFSGFVCQFEHLINAIFSQLYCGMQHYMQVPLSAFLILFVTFVGVGFLTSYLQFTAKEVVMIFFKIALVWAFATQSDFMIAYVFNGFIFFMQSSVYVILEALQAPLGSNTLSPNGGLFGRMDEIINNVVTNSVSSSMVDGTDRLGNPIKVPSFLGGTCKDDPIKIILAIGISMPPLMMILLMTFIKLIMVLLRTLLGYLLCITGVMFLLTFAPIFLALGMFRITQGYFNSWLSLLVGFAVQVFIMFAFLAVAIGLFANSQFGNYKNLIMEWGQEYMHDSIRGGLPKPTGAQGFFCTLCEPDPTSFDIGYDKEVKCKEPKTAIPPTALYSNGPIVEMLGIKIFMLALIAYLFESILNLAPEVATSLSGGIGMMGSSNSSPPMTSGGVSPVPFKGHIQAAKKAAKLTAQSGDSGSLITDGIRNLLTLR